MNPPLLRCAIAGVVLLLIAACEGPFPTDPGVDPGTSSSFSVQENVEVLIAGSLGGWWRASHGPGPAPALSATANAHTTPWRNWGMHHASADPRLDLADVEDLVREFVSERPWLELYRALVSARDALGAIEDGVELGEEGSENRRAVAFASFVQGLALGTLAQLFDEAWILDESADLGSLELSSHSEVLAAAIEKLDRVVDLAEDGTFTIPAEWVGYHQAIDQDGLAELARSWRARLRLATARDPGARAAIDWSEVLSDARNGIKDDWNGAWHPSGDNWAWSLNHIIGSHSGWTRGDYRLIGPADASGAWQEWLAQAPSDRTPFLIDTDDTRITGGSPVEPGRYFGYEEKIIFPEFRGIDRFSFYTNNRWLHLREAAFVGLYTVFPTKELEFIEAEALFHLGDMGAAMEIVNRWRASADLPPFSGPGQTAPGGDRCVPKRPNGACGDLWDALKYEKKIELLHHGAFVDFTDARGWGDLLPGTSIDLPRPALSLSDVLAVIYDAESGAEAARLAEGRSEADLDRKREAIGRFDRSQNADPRDMEAG